MAVHESMFSRLAAGLVAAALVVSTGIAAADDPTRAPPEPRWHVHRVTRAEISAAAAAGIDVYQHLFGAQAPAVARFNRLDSRFVFPGRRLRVPELSAGAEYVPLPTRYPRDGAEARSVLIVLDRQFLGAYERGILVASYPVSSGRPDHETPPGTYRVTRKDAEHRSSIYPEPDGGWPMPWALRFRGSEYWIHAGDLVGRPASHGCVRMFPEDAERLFAWAGIGIRVRVVRSIR
ncbi:MAG: hypothetical protein RL272_673 [Candidatus Parcubacteria bacterium]|jgi:lipoprotein-anchoring transpeptidase ErfK/SrfK